VAEYTYDAVSLLKFQRANGKDEVLKEDTPLPPALMTTEEQAAYSQIQPQIENIVKNYMVSFILDGGIDENYDTFVNDLKAADLDEMIKLVQDAYDRYLVTYQEYDAE
jgi:putative aldouronate transport system substrate-binding protein